MLKRRKQSINLTNMEIDDINKTEKGATMNDEEFARTALGVPGQAIGGKNLPPPEDLKFVIEEEGILCRLHCRGCGFIGDMAQRGLDLLHITSPSDGWSGHYISVSSCEFCSTRYADVEVRKI